MSLNVWHLLRTVCDMREHVHADFRCLPRFLSHFPYKHNASVNVNVPAFTITYAARKIVLYHPIMGLLCVLYPRRISICQRALATLHSLPAHIGVLCKCFHIAATVRHWSSHPIPSFPPPTVSVLVLCTVLIHRFFHYFVKTELARLLVEAKSQTRTPIAGRRQAASGRPRYPDSRKRDRAAATANRKVGGQKTRAQPYGGVGSRGLFGFEDDGEEPLSDSDQALLEIESIARSVGGAAWGAVQETASVFAGIASTLLPEVFPLPQEGEEDSAEEGAEGAPSRQRRRPARISQKRRTRMSRDRASGLRRGASTFVQSSANRAGLALVRSAANGVLRGAEAAADWAGGGAVAREHVLLFIAAFCLAFKRGIGSSVALLVLIRAGRISLQRLLEGGQAAATKRTGEDTAAGARSPRVAAVAAAAGGSTSGSGRREPTSSRGGRRNVPSGKPRRRPTIRQPSKTEERERRSRRTARAARAGRTRAKRGMQGRRRRPVADGLDDSDSDGGCAIM